MKQSDMINAPWMRGWLIAAAAGLVAGAVTYVVGDAGLIRAGLVAIAVCLAVGLFMAMPPLTLLLQALRHPRPNSDPR